MYAPLMLPVSWDDKGNNPPMIRLITAYFKVDYTFVIKSGHFEGTLGIFQRLVSLKVY